MTLDTVTPFLAKLKNVFTVKKLEKTTTNAMVSRTVKLKKTKLLKKVKSSLQSWIIVKSKNCVVSGLTHF